AGLRQLVAFGDQPDLAGLVVVQVQGLQRRPRIGGIADIDKLDGDMRLSRRSMQAENPGFHGKSRSFSPMHAYRTHTCSQLRAEDVGNKARLSGWVHRKRDLGGLLFIDLRDHYGITQCVVTPSNPHFSRLERLRVETVVTLTGDVVARDATTVNANLATGA